MNQNNESLKEILLSLSDAINDVTQKAMEGLTAFVSAFSEVLAELNSIQITPTRKIELERNCKIFIENGWMTSSFLPFETLCNPIEIDDLDEYVISFLNESKLNKIYQLYQTYFDAKDINELKSSVNNGNFKAACLLLLMLVEETFSNLFPNTLSRNIVSGTITTRRMNQGIQGLGATPYEILIYLRGYSIIEYLNKLYENSNDFSDKDDYFKIINRHYLIHGRSTRTYSHKDTLSLIIFIYELITFYEQIK